MSAKQRGRIFLAIAVISGVVAVLLTRELVRRDSARAQQAAAAPVIDTTPVLVARVNLAAGDAIADNQVEIVQWPTDYLPEGSLRAASEIDGRVLKRPVQKEEPIFESSLAPVGAEAGLGSLIRSDRRAMAVKVDPVVVVAGFVKPGSRVDVIATMRRERGALPYTGLILQDLKVLAIDQKLEQNSEAAPELASVVTLEVTPDQAQKLAYAAREGALQLTLRNPIDERRKELPGITGKDVIPPPDPFDARNRPRIETIRGGKIQQQVL
jgi:pilus assembly protein CpaB